MSINIVWKGKTACIVEKGRNMPEIYHGSIGTITDAEMERYRRDLKSVKQKHRLQYAKTNWHFFEGQHDITKEKYSDLPTRKTPTGDKRTIPVGKKKRSPKKSKKEQTKEKIPVITKQSVVIVDTQTGLNVSRYKTVSQKSSAIDRRVEQIKKDKKFADSVVKQKSKVATQSQMQQHKINTERDNWQVTSDNASKAIQILRKQKAELRR